MRSWLAIGLLVASISGSAEGAEREDLLRLKAPEPAARVASDWTVKPQILKFARLVVRVRPEPWARVQKITDGPAPDVSYATWIEGKNALDPAILTSLFAEEMTAAGVRTPGESRSLFADDGASDLLVGATITQMQGNFCRGCGWTTPMMSWQGVMTMNARWEIYSQLQDRVLASVETVGGFKTPRGGLAGDPERLIYEAFRDSLRRLIGREEFRRAVTGVTTPAEPQTAISFEPGPKARRTVSDAATGVVAVFTDTGHGSGFLISQDGSILTNYHVVGSAKYVKVRWSDRSESLGEVIRSDRRRDVAVLKVLAPHRTVLALRVAAPAPGEAVFAIGTPLDSRFQGTVTKGVVSANRTYDGLAFIQSDVSINAGNSGGPLLDESGGVIGICVSGIDINGAPVGINLFIPIGEVLSVLALVPAG